MQQEEKYLPLRDCKSIEKLQQKEVPSTNVEALSSDEFSDISLQNTHNKNCKINSSHLDLKTEEKVQPDELVSFEDEVEDLKYDNFILGCKSSRSIKDDTSLSSQSKVYPSFENLITNYRMNQIHKSSTAFTRKPRDPYKDCQESILDQSTTTSNPLFNSFETHFNFSQQNQETCLYNTEATLESHNGVKIPFPQLSMSKNQGHILYDQGQPCQLTDFLRSLQKRLIQQHTSDNRSCLDDFSEEQLSRISSDAGYRSLRLRTPDQNTSRRSQLRRSQSMSSYAPSDRGGCLHMDEQTWAMVLKLYKSIYLFRCIKLLNIH